jgi:two-component system sensor histidine kinase and response regulator WspE
MSDGGGYGGISLLELFKLEAESHCAALSDGLLALERSPGDVSVIEPLMRAAHSIKGAARIVGLDAIVSLAHAMEECFLAAKNGREQLTSSRVDQLLRGVDVLTEIRGLAEAELAPWTQAQTERIATLAGELKAPPPTVTPTAPTATPIASAPEPSPPTPASAPPEAAAPASASPAGAAAAHLRVSAQALNRILFLAGESTVEASRLQSLRTLIATLRTRQRTLESALQSLHELALTEAHRDRAAEQRPADSAARAETVVSSLAAAADGLQSTILDQSTRFDEVFRRVEELSGALYTEVIRSRMRPFSEGVTAFPRMVRDIARQLGKTVELRIVGESVEVDRDILQKLESPLTHMIRNSLDHGLELPAERLAAGKPERGIISLIARHQSGMLVIEVRDDGRGIDPEAVRRKVVERKLVDAATSERLTRAELMEFPFLPGFSTKPAATELSGRGVGLDIVRSMVADVSGTVTLDSEPGRGARFTLRLPVTRSVIRAAVVRVGDQMLAVPLARLDRVVCVPGSAVHNVQGRMQITLESESVGLVHASDMFTGVQAPPREGDITVLVIGAGVGGGGGGGGGGGESCGLIVDEISGEEDLVVRPLDPRLGTVAHIAAVAIRADGAPVFVIDVDDLWRSLKRALQEGRPLGVPAREAERVQHARRRVLVVDDSITVREVERQLLLRRGYAVDVAVDGKEGYNALRTGHYDLLITDVDMPRMTGIELVRAVRKEPKLVELPIIIVSYKDREEDRRAGLEAGASAYLTKGSFHDESLIRMVEDLIGGPT